MGAAMEMRIRYPLRKSEEKERKKKQKKKKSKRRAKERQGDKKDRKQQKEKGWKKSMSFLSICEIPIKHIIFPRKYIKDI